jgi:hypothetical protein
MSIYRHQASTVERKKAIMAEKLQDALQEMALGEQEVRERKNQMRDAEGNEIVTSVQVRFFPFFVRCNRYCFSSKTTSTNCEQKPTDTRRNAPNCKIYERNWASWRALKKSCAISSTLSNLKLFVLLFSLILHCNRPLLRNRVAVRYCRRKMSQSDSSGLEPLNRRAKTSTSSSPWSTVWLRD